jgi:DNA (cytosine-5)-methyltransferase 1
MSKPRAYYSEWDPYAAQWLRNLISAGHIAPGDVDERSIEDVRPDDLRGYTQCHFFAGIGGWSLAARLAGWPDDRELWSGSEPCQPYSVAGKGLGEADERFLRPHVHRLVAARRPAVYVGEQVAAAAGKNWLDRVHSDMESIGYTCRSVVVPACAVDAPHRRDRLWFVADPDEPCAGAQREQRSRELSRTGGDPGARAGDVAYPDSIVGQVDQNARRGEDGSGSRQVAGSSGARHGAVADANGARGEARLSEANGRHEGLAEIADNRSNRRAGAWGEHHWLAGADGKARRVEPGIRLLAHGVPARVGKLRAYGNAIVPQVAAEVIGAYLDALDERFRLTDVSLLSPTEDVFS